MKIVIIDDEINACEILRHLIGKISGFEVIGIAHGVKDGIALISDKQPDIVLLDIKMNDGTGFDLLHKVEKNFHLIFTTAYDNYAIKAFKFSATDYLLKPIALDEIKDSLDRLTRTSQNQLKLLQASYQDKKFDEIYIPGVSNNKLVEIEDVLYCQSDNNYTWFYFQDGTNLLTSKTLKFYESLLPDRLFFRIHQSYLINLNRIKVYQPKNKFITMEGDVELPVSVRKKQMLLTVLKERRSKL